MSRYHTQVNVLHGLACVLHVAFANEAAQLVLNASHLPADAVMAKFDRDSTGTGATELAELRRVRHIHSGGMAVHCQPCHPASCTKHGLLINHTGTWYKAADLSSADAERLADQNAEASSNAQQSGGVDPVFRYVITN